MSKMGINRKLERLRNKHSGESFANNIASVGLMITRGRVSVLSVFYMAVNSRLSAVDVYKLLSNSNVPMSLSTVYRILNDFTQAGLLLVISVEHSGKVFELNKGKNSGIILCPICNKYGDIPELELNEVYRNNLGKLGFNLDQYTFSLTSICASCNILSAKKAMTYKA